MAGHQIFLAAITVAEPRYGALVGTSIAASLSGQDAWRVSQVSVFRMH